MKKIFLLILSLGIIGAIAYFMASQVTNSDGNQTSDSVMTTTLTTTKEDSTEKEVSKVSSDGDPTLIDQIDIDQSFDFKNATVEEKTKEFEKYDSYTHANQVKTPTKDLDSIKVIESEEAYNQVIEASKESPQLIYTGYEECPFCMIFAPKLDAIARDYGATIHYYNVKDRNEDKNFKEVIEKFFKISEVPHAFLIKDGKIEGSDLNSQSPMADMEKYILEVAK